MAKNVASKRDTKDIEAMDVVASLRKISRELINIGPETDPIEYMDRVEGAAWLIAFIADGLETEFQHAANRATKFMEDATAPGDALKASVTELTRD